MGFDIKKLLANDLKFKTKDCTYEYLHKKQLKISSVVGDISEEIFGCHVFIY